VLHDVDNVSEVVGIAASIRTEDPLLNSGFELSKYDAQDRKIVPYQDNTAILYNATTTPPTTRRGMLWGIVLKSPSLSSADLIKDLSFTPGKLTIRFVLLDQTGLDPLTGDFSAKTKELEVNTDMVVLNLTKAGDNVIETTHFKLPNNTNDGVGPWDTIRAEVTYETPPDTRWAALLSLDYLCIGYCFTPPDIPVEKGDIIAETGVVLFRHSISDYQGKDPLKLQAPKGGQAPIVQQLSIQQLLSADMKEKLAGDISGF
jgi:hypothetical protein